MSLPQGKPLTKALHTTRIVGRLAKLWAQLELDAGRRLAPEADGLAFLFVLHTIGNAAPVDPQLRDDCLAACQSAIAEARAESHRRAAA